MYNHFNGNNIHSFKGGKEKFLIDNDSAIILTALKKVYC